MKLAILVTFLFFVMMSIMHETEARGVLGFRAPMMGMGGRMGGRMGGGSVFGRAFGIKPRSGFGTKNVLGPRNPKPIKTDTIFAPIDVNAIVEPVLNAVMPASAPDQLDIVEKVHNR